MSIGQGGPFDREMTRWSAAGMAQILDQTPEADFSEARENFRLYQSGASHYSDVVVTRDIIRLHQAGLGRYAADELPPVPESPPPALESTTPRGAFSAPFMVAADPHNRSFVERLPQAAGVLPESVTPEMLQRTTAYFAGLRERHGRQREAAAQVLRSSHELRPGELPAPHVHHPLHSLDDVMQAMSWHERQERQREQAAQALREGLLLEPRDGHLALPAFPASSSRPEHRSDGQFGFGQSRTPSYTFSSGGGSVDSIS